MKTLTIFTPTYNRADELHRLYESLCRQSDGRFTWLIVDDGSTDNTESIVARWINEGRINIDYHKQSNAGKSQAHNVGVDMCRTDLFVCVDSDDYLTDDAVEQIHSCENALDQENCVGILAFKDVTTLASDVSYSTLYDAYTKHGLRGDTMLVYKTAVISKFSFPLFSGEKFVPESYLYDLLDTCGQLYILRRVLYKCEYLPGGYTSNMARLLCNSKQAYMAYIEQRLRLHSRPGKERFLDSIRYMAMAKVAQKKSPVLSAPYPAYAALAWLPAMVFYYKRYRGL